MGFKVGNVEGKVSEHLRFRERHCHSFGALFYGTPANIRTNLTFLKLESWTNIFAADSMGLSSLKISGVLCKTILFRKSAFHPLKVI